MIPKRKFCHQCGKEIPVVGKFCNYCGTSQVSLEELPPTHTAQPAQQPSGLPRRNQSVATTFTPIAPGDDDDDGGIRADRVNSVHDLNITLSELEIEISNPGISKESFSSVVRSGLGLPQGYREQARVGGFSTTAVQDILKEGSSIRPGTSTEIK